MRAFQSALLCLLLAVMPSCSPDVPDAESPAAHEGMPDAMDMPDVEGVVRVQNPAEGLWEHADRPPIRFEPDGVFGGTGSHITSIAGAVVDKNDSVYIYDAQLSELSAFSGEGGLLWRAGSPGAEADQFHGVRGITYDGNETIWVVNQDGARLDAWDLTGEHGASLDLDELGVGKSFMGGFLPPDRIALLADMVYATAANEYVVVRLGDDPEIEARFRIGAEPMTPIPPGVVMQLSHYFENDKIYVGGWENYALREYDSTGTMLLHVSREVDYLRRPGFAARGDRYLGVSFGGLGAPIILQSGHWLVLASWPTNIDDPNTFAELAATERPSIEWASSLDLFDPDGRFLYSVQSPGRQVPEIGRPWAVGPTGRLFTVSADPVPHVRRYRVVLEPPAGS